MPEVVLLPSEAVEIGGPLRCTFRLAARSFGGLDPGLLAAAGLGPLLGDLEHRGHATALARSARQPAEVEAPKVATGELATQRDKLVHPAFARLVVLPATLVVLGKKPQDHFVVLDVDGEAVLDAVGSDGVRIEHAARQSEEKL